MANATMHRLAVIFAPLAVFMLTACSPGEKVELHTVETYRDIGDALETGNGYIYSDLEFAFLTGAATEVLECPLPGLEEKDRIELAMISTVGMLSVGTQQNPPKTFDELLLKPPIEKPTAWAAGILAVQELECATPIVSELAANILKVDRSNRADANGEDAVFTKTCTPHHGYSACICIGMMSRTTHPNVFQTPYTRQYMGEIVTTMGFSGLGIMLGCGVTRY